MLEAADHRPDVDTIYVLDVPVEVLTEQIKALSPTFEAAIDDGTLTVFRRDPTQSLLAALVIEGGLVLTDSEILSAMTQLRRAFERPIRLDIANATLMASLEQYEPSARLKQAAYTVADLPA